MAAYYKNPKVDVEVLTRPGTASSPEYVINMLDKFKQKYHLNRSDELWMVIDVDRWGEKKLSLIAMLCRQKNYFLAVSNPCSDIWFLIHKQSLVDYLRETLNEFFENKKINKRTRLEIELIKVYGVINKKGVAPPTHSRSARCRSFGGVISKVCRKNKVSEGISKTK